jgi:hypothetical protein
MASIVEWQSLKMQEYRHHLRNVFHNLLARFGVKRPLDPVPMSAGPYDPSMHID